MGSRCFRDSALGKLSKLWIQITIQTSFLGPRTLILTSLDSDSISFIIQTLDQLAYLQLFSFLQKIIRDYMRKDLKIVAISDTHASPRLEELIANHVSGDIFIHAGDFTRYGREQHFLSFFTLLEKLQFRHKIVIAGNHDISLDSNILKPERKAKLLAKYPCSLKRQKIIEEIKARAHYLEHQPVQIEGVTIFGSPYTLKYSSGAFQYNKEEDHLVWKNLPQNIDILVTHSPPYGILDASRQQKHAGSVGLMEAVKKIRPKLHIFGHIHQAHGRQEHNGTVFMNVAKQHQIFYYQY